MKKLLLNAVILFVVSQQGFSQKGQFGNSSRPFEATLDFQVKVYLNPGYEKNSPNYKGSPYLNPDWESGSLTFNSGKKYENLKFMYDVYNKSICFINGKDTASIGNPEIVKEISMGTSTILYSVYTDGTKVDKDYFEVLVAGEYKLLLHRSCKFLPAEKVIQGYDQSEPAKFITDKTYYIKKANEPAVAVDKEQKFLSTFQGKTEDATNFIKKNKLKLKKEQDLAKLVKFVNGEEM